jgi:hypothetical protein
MIGDYSNKYLTINFFMAENLASKQWSGQFCRVNPIVELSPSFLAWKALFLLIPHWERACRVIWIGTLPLCFKSNTECSIWESIYSNVLYEKVYRHELLKFYKLFIKNFEFFNPGLFFFLIFCKYRTFLENQREILEEIIKSWSFHGSAQSKEEVWKRVDVYEKPCAWLLIWFILEDGGLSWSFTSLCIHPQSMDLPFFGSVANWYLRKLPFAHYGCISS